MPEKDSLVPAVPAQEAPRCFGCDKSLTYCDCHYPQVAEPQAGAQVPQKGPWKVIEDADFSGSKDYPFMIVLDRGAGPCEPNVVASRMSKANADLIVAQAGAQVPSQDVKCLQAPYDPLNLRNRSYIWPQEIPAIADRYEDLESAHAKLAEMYSRELQRWVDAMAALRSIRAYATEAAKTPITREDMHDPLKAQTFYDEHEGFIRLVLSEAK